MNYTVRWLPAAERELADLWLNSTRRADVTRAAHAIDQALQRSPQDLGESRPKKLRIHFEPPLVVLFRVRARIHLVEVAHVWEYH
jgi:hypothetical protein